MSYDFLTHAMRQWQAETARAPRLAIVSNETKTSQGDAPMDTPAAHSQPTAHPLHEHGAFIELAAAVRLLALGAEALQGIGAIMQPEREAGDERILARRGEASAVFAFFGEALKEPVQIASEAAERLERAAKRIDA